VEVSWVPEEHTERREERHRERVSRAHHGVETKKMLKLCLDFCLSLVCVVIAVPNDEKFALKMEEK
jgi:hypothetical protein